MSHPTKTAEDHANELGDVVEVKRKQLDQKISDFYENNGPCPEHSEYEDLARARDDLIDAQRILESPPATTPK